MQISQAAAVLKVAVRADLPVMLWGPPGIGKSDLVHQLAEDTSRALIDVRISQLDSVDLRGVPNVRDGITVWNPPEFLPRDENSTGILFLDEINHGSTSTMAAAYQLVLNRQLGKYRLPAGWSIVAAGNRLQDRSIVNNMSAALRNRFIHIDVEVNLDDWCIWANRHGIDPNVIGFLRYRPTLLNEADLAGTDSKRSQEVAQRLKDAKAFATPRSWSFLSKLLQVGIPGTVEHETYGSVVGEGAAAEFIAYLKYAAKMPNLDAIFVNPKSAPLPEEPATKYATVSGLAAKMTKDNFDRGITYCDRLDPEFGVMCVKDALTRLPDLAETQAFNEWALRNKNVLN